MEGCCIGNSYNVNYQQLKQKMYRRWRSRIFERDGFKCRCCGSTYKLTLAHITDIAFFIRKLGFRVGVPWSFRYDNLVTLCWDCHNPYHRSKRFNLLGSKYQKARNVNKLFYELKEDRNPLVVNDVRIW